MLGLGLGLTNFGTKGGVVDTPDLSGSSAAAFLALWSTDGQGLVFDFANDQSAKIQDTSTPANNYSSSGIVSAGALTGPGGKITYTSPSTKLCLQSNGYYARQAHNLITYSEQLDNAAWTKAAGVTIGADAVAASDGTTTADKIKEVNGASTTHRILQAATTVTGAQYVFAFEYKAADRRYIHARAGTIGGVCIDTNDNTLTTGYQEGPSAIAAFTSQSNVSLGNGWYRFSGVWTATSTSTSILIYVSNSATDTSYTGDGSSGVYVSKVHVYRYPANTDYLRTTSAAVYAPPYEWDTSGNCLGIRVEEARTNLCLRSKELDNATWTKSNASVTANGSTAPDNTTTSDLFIPSSGSALHYITQNISFTTGTAYTFSFHAKPGSRRYLLFTVGGTAFSNQYAVYDLTGGTVTESSGTLKASMVADPVGGYRCIFTVTAGASASDGIFFIASDSATPGTRVPNATGDGASGYYITWVQAEAGSFDLSFVETFGSTVTRAADSLSIATSAFPYNTTTSSLYADGITYSSVAAAAFPGLLSVNRGNGTANVIMILFNGATSSALVEMAATTTQASIAIANDKTAKIAGAYAANDVSGAADGTLGTPDTSSTYVSSLTTLYVGRGYSTTQHANGHIKAIAYIPERISNANLQTMTT